MENSQTTRLTPGSSANSTSKWAKSTCACSPGGFSKHTSKPVVRGGCRSHAVSENAVAARLSALLDLTPQTHRREAGIGRQALLQIRLERIGDPRPRRPCFVFRRLQPLGDGATNGLPIDAEVAGNGGNRQALSMKIQNHHEFPEFDHRAAPSRQREQHRRVGRRRACQGSFRKARHYENWGISNAIFGEN